jgi:hypothetical protein
VWTSAKTLWIDDQSSDDGSLRAALSCRSTGSVQQCCDYAPVDNAGLNKTSPLLDDTRHLIAA